MIILRHLLAVTVGALPILVLGNWFNLDVSILFPLYLASYFVWARLMYLREKASK